MNAQEHTTLFELKQLGLSYRAHPVLKGIQWRWERGEHWALLGPNGAGKTALASILAGEEQHFSGHFTRGPALDSAIAYVCFERGRRLCERDRKLDCAEFESSAVDVGTRVRDLLGGDAPESERQQVIDLLGLEGVLDRGLRYVSTGEMRKSLLASALLEKPALMILDSPLDGLDRSMQQQLGEALDTIIGRSHATLVLCRNAEDVPAACTHVALVDRGRLVSAGERDEVLRSTTCRTLMAPPPLRLRAPDLPVPVREGPEKTLELRNVAVSFGEHSVFRDLNWTLRRGQHCMISGPNGCGKSTLLDLLTGDNHKAYGQDVSLFGHRRGSGESVWDIKSRFGRVDARMQFAFPSGCTVIDTVLSGFFDSLGLIDTPGDRQRATAMQWLRALGLDQAAGDEFAAQSFGMQRLILLARAVVKNPTILLLDEATLSLDARHVTLMLNALDHVVEHSDSQLLFVSHSAGEVPACINQTLTFIPGADGSTVSVEDRSPGQ